MRKDLYPLSARIRSGQLFRKAKAVFKPFSTIFRAASSDLNGFHRHFDVSFCIMPLTFSATAIPDFPDFLRDARRVSTFELTNKYFMAPSDKTNCASFMNFWSLRETDEGFHIFSNRYYHINQIVQPPLPEALLPGLR